MKFLSIISAFFIFSVCNAQTQEKAISFLKSSFPKPDTISVGRIFYDEKYYDETNLPIENTDVIIKECLPQYKFYTFSFLFKGCYTIERQGAILIYDNHSDKHSVLVRSGFQIEKEFIDLVGSYKTSSRHKFDKYLSSISKLIFSMTDVTVIAESIPSKNEHIFYDPKGGVPITFEIKKNQIQNIRFKY